MKYFMMLVVLVGLAACSTGCNMTQQQQVAIALPLVQGASEAGTYYYLKQDTQAATHIAQISQFVVAVKDIVATTGSVDLTGLQTLANTYLGNNSPIADIVLSTAQNYINSMPQVSNPSQNLIYIQQICLASVNGVAEGILLYQSGAATVNRAQRVPLRPTLIKIKGVACL